MSIKLTARERRAIAKATRRHLAAEGYDGGYGIDTARAFIETQVDDLGRFEGVPYTDISDYAQGLARFVCPREARDF
jgi:hypothetical protein